MTAEPCYLCGKEKPQYTQLLCNSCRFDKIAKAAAKDTRTVTSGEIRWLVSQYTQIACAANELLQKLDYFPWHEDDILEAARRLEDLLS